MADFAASEEITLVKWRRRSLWQRCYEFAIGYVSAILLRVF